MVGRTYVGSTGYRYGFGSQEKDDEISSSGNSYTAEYWQYDSRLGRRWNVDPVVKPWESSFATFSNNPIFFNDPDGRDAEKRAKKSAEKNGGTATQEKDGSWTTSYGKVYADPNSSNGKGVEHVNETFKDNIFERFGKAVANFWNNSTGVAEFGVKVDAGVQAANFAVVIKSSLIL